MGSMSIELKETIQEFLRDRHIHELAYRQGYYNCLLIRSRYDEETDFFYLLQSYRDGDPHHINDQPDYAGIYSHVHGTLVAPGYDLRECCDEKWNADEILRRFSENVQARILKLIDGKPVPLTKDAEPSRFDRDSFLAYGASSQALELFYEGKNAVYAPSYRLINPPTEQFIRIVNHPDEEAQTCAEAYVRQNAADINDMLWRTELVSQKLRELREMPGEHHLRLRIAQALTTQKMVRIEIDKEGRQLNLRIEANALKRANSTDYSLWHMDTHSRELFEQTYGRQARLMASDIMRITYSRVTLYEKEAA